PRRPRPRLVRGRARGLGPALRARASRRPLPPQPDRRARRGPTLLAEAARLPPPLLREAPPGGRAPVDAVHGTRPLAGVAHGSLPRPAPPLPSLLGGGAARRLHARRVEAPLLPAAQPARARAADGARGAAARRRARPAALRSRPAGSRDGSGRGPGRARARSALADALALRPEHARRAPPHRARRAIRGGGRHRLPGRRAPGRARLARVGGAPGV